MGKMLLDYLSDGGKNLLFGLPATEELAGMPARLPDGRELRFDKELAVKCDDDLFLAEKEGRLYLLEELPDESLRALDAAETAAGADALPAALEGWETDLCCASGYVLTAAFKDGRLVLSPSPEPDPANPFPAGEAAAAKATEPPLASLALKAVETGDKRFLLHFPETGETVFLDARRFLLYGIFRGRIVSGFVEVPPRE